jgi:hypothetical protein
LLLLALGHRRALLRTLAPFWICGFALWMSEFQRTDIVHLIIGSPILLVLFLGLLEVHPWARSLKSLKNLVLLATIPFAIMNVSVPLSARIRIETRCGTIYSQQPDRALEFVQQHTRRGDSVFVYPYNPLYNFLSDTRNPTRFSYLIYGWHDPRQFTEALENLRAKQVEYVLWDTSVNAENMARFFPRYRVPPPNEQIMERYIQAQYHQVALENGWRIMQRNPNDNSGGSGALTSTPCAGRALGAGEEGHRGAGNQTEAAQVGPESACIPTPYESQSGTAHPCRRLGMPTHWTYGDEVDHSIVVQISGSDHLRIGLVHKCPLDLTQSVESR